MADNLDYYQNDRELDKSSETTDTPTPSVNITSEKQHDFNQYFRESEESSDNTDFPPTIVYIPPEEHPDRELDESSEDTDTPTPRVYIPPGKQPDYYQYYRESEESSENTDTPTPRVYSSSKKQANHIVHFIEGNEFSRNTETPANGVCIPSGKHHNNNHDTKWKEFSKKIWKSNIEMENREPTLVLSVIGDSDSFVPKPWSKSVFHTALMEAAKSGGVSWILYQGKDLGVSSIVEEAYHSYVEMEEICNNNSKNVHLISITKEIEKKGSSEIKNTDSTGLLVTIETFIFKQDVSFFQPKYGTGNHLDLKMPVPIVIVALEGGIESIQHIAGALEEGIPVVVIKGTGMAADLIIEYLDDDKALRRKAAILLGISFSEDVFIHLEEPLKCIAKQRDLVSIFDIDSHDPLIFSNLVGEAVVNAWAMKNFLNKRYVKNIPAVKGPLRGTLLDQQEDRITEGHELYYENRSYSKQDKKNGSILKGRSITINMIKGKQMSYLAKQDTKGHDMRPYVLQSKFNTPTSLPLYFYFSFQIFQEHEDKETRIETAKILLLEALKANRTDYVQVLLDKKIHQTIDDTDVLELYKETVRHHKDEEENCSSCIHWILTQVDKKAAHTVCNHSNHKHDQGSAKNRLALAKKLARKLLGYKEMKHYDNKVDDTGNNIKGSIIKEDKSKRRGENNTENERISDILLWTIFANRPEEAEICWIRGKDHLLTALICTTILRKLSKKAGNIKEQTLCTELEDHAQLFEARALSLLDRMYETHPECSTQLMDKTANVWGIFTTPLTFAYENYMYDVVAHPCSQKNLNYVWYNNLTPDIKPFLKSICSYKFLKAPLTKYIINYLFYLLMLVMYSAFVLTSISDFNYSRNMAKLFEFYVYFWGLGDLLNEILNCYGGLDTKGKSHRSLYSRIKRYFYDFWNIVDFVSYILLIAALLVRHLYRSTEYRMSRRLFSLSLLVMYLRFLEVFLMFRTLGPTLIMIKEMLKDLLHFLVLAVFAVIGVGIYYHANLWPDHTNIFGHGNWTDWRIWKILYYPYWQLHAELFDNFLEGKGEKGCTNDSTIWLQDPSVERCPQEEWSVIAVSAVYMLFSNLLLVNLVIAMFSYTFERVQENSKKLWRFERYTVIKDYEKRIPSPFNIVILPCVIARKWLCKRCKGCEINSDSKKEKKKDLSKFERIIACKLTDKN